MTRCMLRADEDCVKELRKGVVRIEPRWRHPGQDRPEDGGLGYPTARPSGCG